MGCASSSAIPKLAEERQVAPVEAAFCAKTITTLRLRDRFWDYSNEEDFLIRDTEWNQDVFSIRGTKSAMKTLRDPNRRPLVHMKRDFMASLPTFNAFDAKASAAKLFSIQALHELSVTFQNPATGKMCRVGLNGDWSKREASFWMKQGRNGLRRTIGRVFRPTGSIRPVSTTLSTSLSCLPPDDVYFLTILGGIDMALLVLICIALEQAHSEK
ncbi:hypothetical protein CCR75_005505 [Bremia lactucae]|uniref:Tubby C-terminal domain-containing protein n=1 Tax=Bremia lactucae TaxID=4779 RepID=A0A976IJG6_BRELC|nr:hypothetical protein CCR75_005505 [Bremia lactucae]